MTGFLNSHGTSPIFGEHCFVDITFGLDEEFDSRRGCPLENLLYNPYDPFDDEALEIAALDDDDLDDDFDLGRLSLSDQDYLNRFELPHDEDHMDPATWVQFRYADIIAKLEPQEAEEPVNIEAMTATILPLASQSGNFESRRLSLWEAEFKEDRKWKSRKARKPRRFDHASVRTFGAMSLAH